MLQIDLSGKTTLILGGSRGIGSAITQRLANAGATTRLISQLAKPRYIAQLCEVQST